MTSLSLYMCVYIYHSPSLFKRWFDKLEDSLQLNVLLTEQMFSAFIAGRKFSILILLKDFGPRRWINFALVLFKLLMRLVIYGYDLFLLELPGRWFNNWAGREAGQQEMVWNSKVLARSHRQAMSREVLDDLLNFSQYILLVPSLFLFIFV